MTAESRPHVVVNAAMSIDGKIDTISRRGARISSLEDWERVDSLRAASDAVMVGGHTLIGEDPNLTVKSARLRAGRTRRGQGENPIKVGVVTRADLRAESRFLNAGGAPVIVFTTTQTSKVQMKALSAAGTEVVVLGEDRVDLPQALKLLHERGIRRLLVEGGGTLIGELFRLGLVDEMFIYIAPVVLGGATAPTLADGSGMEEGAAARLKLKDSSVSAGSGIVLHYAVEGGRGG